MRTPRLAAIGSAAAALALTASACSNPNSDATSSSAARGGSSSASANKHLSIGFFGFAKANSFAQATWAGIQQYANGHNASATFIDSNFNGSTQVNELQDAVTAKRFDVVIVQANDGTAMVNPVRQAIAAGITVVVEFTPIGGDYYTSQPQVPGTYNIVDPPAVNGSGLALLGIEACGSLGLKHANCKVAYLQGLANFPLDSARTNVAVAALKSSGISTVISNFVGGYTPDTGRAAMQNLLQSHPDVNVVIGSSQALEGAMPLVGGRKIAFVGNGGSTQAFNYVENGTWFGVYDVPEKAEGAKAAEIGLEAARGKSAPTATRACNLTTFNCLGTAQTLKGRTADYTD